MSSGPITLAYRSAGGSPLCRWRATGGRKRGGRRFRGLLFPTPAAGRSEQQKQLFHREWGEWIQRPTFWLRVVEHPYFDLVCLIQHRGTMQHRVHHQEWATAAELFLILRFRDHPPPSPIKNLSVAQNLLANRSGVRISDETPLKVFLLAPMSPVLVSIW